MRRRLFLACSAPLFGRAASAGANGQYRIGYLSSGDAPGSAHLTRAFIDGLRAAGYVEGRNLTLISRYGNGKVEDLPRLAKELLDSNVDVIFAPSSPSALAVKKLSTSMPVVFCWLSDPVGVGAVQSFAHPGGNLTGLSTLHKELSAKRLEVFKEAFPRIQRVGAMLQKGHPATASQLAEMEAAARALKLTVAPVLVSSSQDISEALRPSAVVAIDGLVVIVSPVTWVNRKQIVQQVRTTRLLTIYDMPEAIDDGGLISFSVDMRDQFRRAAGYVDKILHGERPADLPVEQPTQFQLRINMRTAQELGVTIPDTVMLQAELLS